MRKGFVLSIYVNYMFTVGKGVIFISKDTL